MCPLDHAELRNRTSHAHGAALGVREITTLLHDGRATGLEQAILAHDGQGKKARDRFTRLLSFEKTRLIAFLNSL